MDDERKEHGANLASIFPLLDFRGIPGIPNEELDSDVSRYTPFFHGKGDSTILHITSFIEVVTKFNIVHEDNWMQIFVSTLDEHAWDWYYEYLPCY